MISTLAITLHLVCATPVAAQATWFVDASNPACPGSGTPGDPFCLIQDAIDAASDGDTVLVLPGTYNENLNVTADLLIFGHSSSTTIIDGGGLETTVRVPVGAAVTIAEVTIQNGNSSTGGGGISSFGTLTLADCTVRGNQGSSGGGIEVCDSDLSLHDTQVLQNTGGHGGGILIHSSSPSTPCNVAIYDSLIDENLSRVGYGGGIQCGNAGDDDNTLLIVRSTISNNTAQDNGGGLSHFGLESLGGGLTILDSRVEANSTPAEGGGLFVRGSATVRHSVVFNNRSEVAGGGLNAAPPADLRIHDSEVTGNFSGNWGGGIYVFPTGNTSARLTRCTVAGNTAITGGGIYCWQDVFIDHSIIAANIAAVAPDTSGTITSMGYNLVEDPYYAVIVGDLTGNQVGVSPAFVDAYSNDFTLSSTSPCIDAGNPTKDPGGLDVGGNPRFLDGDLDKVQVVDMGAHEYSNVRLDITGNPTPGGDLRFTTTGKDGLFAILWIGTAPGEFALPPHGSLFFDPSSYYDFMPLAVIPETREFGVPENLQIPVTVYLQAMAWDAVSRAGNTGNPVALSIQ